MNRKEIFIAAIVLTSFFSLSIFVCRGVLATPGVLLHHDWWIPPYNTQILVGAKENFFAWINSLGYVPSRGQIPGLTIGFFSLFGADGEIITKSMVVLSIFLSGMIMYYVLRKFGKSYSASFIAGIFYMLTPWIYVRIIAGDVGTLFSYPLLPLIVYAFTRLVHAEQRKEKMFYVLCIGLLFSYTGIIFSVMSLLAFLLYSIVDVISEKRKKSLLQNIECLVLTVFILFLFNLSWIVPTVLSTGIGTTSIPVIPKDVIDRSTHAQVENVARLMGLVLRWFPRTVEDNTLLFPAWRYSSVLILHLAFFAPVISRKKNTVFFLLLAVVSIFLGKGTNPPLGEFYEWAYLNLPYFHIFREPNKWVMLTCLSHAFLISETVKWLVKFISQGSSSLIFKINRYHLKFKAKPLLFLALVLLTISTYSWPFFTGDFAGDLKAVNFPSEYSEVNDWLASQDGDFTVLWLPLSPRTQYNWMEDYDSQAFDVIASYSIKPDYMPRADHPTGDTGRFFFFVNSLLYNKGATKYLAKLLAIAGVKYLIVRNDAEGYRWKYLPGNYSTSQLVATIKDQEGFRLIKSVGSIDVYQNDFYNPSKIFATSSSAVITGGMRSLISLSYLDSIDFSDSAFFFADQLSGTEMAGFDFMNDVVIMNDNFYDLVFSALKSYEIDPVNCINETGDARKGWSRLYMYNWPAYWAYLDLPYECAVASGNSTLNIRFQIQSQGKYEVWLKLFFGIKGSLLDVVIDGTEIGAIQTNAPRDFGFSWTKVNASHLSEGYHTLTVRHNGEGDNVLAKILIAPEEEISKAISDLTEALKNKNISYLFEAEQLKGIEEQQANVFTWVFDNTTGWLLDAARCNFTHSIEPEGFVIEAYFDGPAAEEEYVNLYSDVSSIDLEKYPQVELTYRVNDSVAQTMLMIYYLDFNRDGYPDYQCFLRWKAPPSTEMHTVRLNAYEIAKKAVPGKEHYDLVKLRILAAKTVGYDASKSPRIYSFLIKNVRVFGFPWSVSSDFSSNASQGLVICSNVETTLPIGIFAPKEGDYDVFMRVKNDANKTVCLKVDEQYFYSTLNSSNEFGLSHIATVHFNSGNVEVEFACERGLAIDLIMFSPSNVTISSWEHVKSSYKEINPTKYVIGLNSSASSILVFREPFNY
ncbi:MAG: alpha-(1-_3)-arabinofuranosyltransferase domain-containing protein, partial [Candidatus Baldrarchaeia archaeon]